MNKKINFSYVTAKSAPHKIGAINLYARRLWNNRPVALLGGSFNPAHEGHFHIARLALKRLGAGHVWWMVSPQNPLKSTNGMAPMERRFASAQAQANHPNMIVTDIETRMGTQYTVDSLRVLKKYFPHTRFIWVMGEDNLSTIERWQKWRDLFKMVHVAIFHRKWFRQAHMVLKPLKKLEHHRVNAQKARLLKQIEGDKKCVLLHSRLNFTSSTGLRKKGVRA